jgi:cytochrome c556
MSLSRRFAPRIWGAALAVLVSGAALAAGLTGVDALKDRQTHMKGLGAATKAISDQFHSGAPNPAVIKAEAAKIDSYAQELPTWFPKGSGPETGAKTEALALIWTDPSGFAGKAHALAVAAKNFDVAAQAGDQAALGAAGHDLGAACKGCHDTYRAKEKS